jgi:hypothetical protein
MLSLAGCSVELGSIGDGGCTPAPDVFVSDVWPNYLAPTGCAMSGCHSFSDGHGSLRLKTPEATAPAPGTPLASWPPNWRSNYLSAAQLVDCTSPLASRLLTVPEGEGDLHPPGPVVLDRAAAAAAVTAWAK